MNKSKFEENGIDTSKIQVVYRAVERYSNLSAQENTFNILFAGNGFYRKGGIELLMAFSHFKHPEARLTIISSMEVDWKIYPTPEEVEFVNQTIANDPRIQLLSNVEHQEVIQKMRTSHAFVATTHDDPFNNTILEALACGVPVITSDIRSIPEYVFDQQNGFTTTLDGKNQEEVAEFILNKLNTLYHDSQLHTKLANNAHHYCKEIFDIQVRNNQLKTIYDKALE